MRAPRPAVLLTLALLGACSPGSASSAPEPALGDSLRVVRGQSVTLDGGRLTVAVTELVDSRCAANVVCVWEGDAAVTLRVESGGAVATPTLHTRLEPKRATHVGYELVLLDVTPYPGTTPPNAPVTPIAVLRVTRR